MAKHTTPTARQAMDMMFCTLYLSRLRHAVANELAGSPPQRTHPLTPPQGRGVFRAGDGVCDYLISLIMLVVLCFSD